MLSRSSLFEFNESRRMDLSLNIVLGAKFYKSINDSDPWFICVPYGEFDEYAEDVLYRSCIPPVDCVDRVWGLVAYTCSSSDKVLMKAVDRMGWEYSVWTDLNTGIRTANLTLPGCETIKGESDTSRHLALCDAVRQVKACCGV